MSQPILIPFPLFKGMPVATVGTSLTTSVLDIDVPQFRNILPRVTGMFLYGLTENVAAADFEWNVGFISGMDRSHEAPPIDITVGNVNFDSTLPYGARNPEYVTVANFLLESRLQAWWRNKNQISGVKSANITAVLYVRLAS